MIYQVYGERGMERIVRGSNFHESEILSQTEERRGGTERYKEEGIKRDNLNNLKIY